MRSRVAVICTVLNEQDTIRELLVSLLAQSRLPDEVVIVDGGSNDSTTSIIKENSRSFAEAGVEIRLIVAPGANISAGRNLAIAHADAEIIASTDGGVWLEPEWLSELLAGFGGGDENERADVVAGFFRSDPRSTLELAMGATVLPGLDEIDPGRFLPSSRSVAFTKSAWARAGGYPEWLDYCEDVVFDLALRRDGCRVAFAPRAIAHFRPRGTLRSFFRQYYRYARGDGKAGLWPRRHLIRYSSYTLGTLALLLGFWYKVAWLAGLLAGLSYLYRPYRRLLPALGPYRLRDRLRLLSLVPLVRLVGDCAKMAGYPAGLLWRLRRGKSGA
jgi:glycosyltransferase involved in cell wall biosynthesis